MEAGEITTTVSESVLTDTTRPNVIFILADDLGWRDLGSYGADLYETPQLDSLADSAIRFTNAYSASPLCSPTRASILTGQEPGRLRLTDALIAGKADDVRGDPVETTEGAEYQKATMPQSVQYLSNKYTTFAEVLKQHGYATAFMGKWHLGDEPHIPENQGFDEVVGGRHHAGPPPPGRYFAPWDLNTLPDVPNGTPISDVLTDAAIDFVSRNVDNPFLLCLWFYDVHTPLQAKEGLIQKYSQKLGPIHFQRNPTMGAMIETMDSNIGRLLDALKRLQIDDETIIIFTSDNGGNQHTVVDGATATNNAPLRSGKGSIYEGGVRVPMLVRAPHLQSAAGVSDVTVSSVDHYATILDMLDIPFPEGVFTDGVSYRRAIQGESYLRKPIFAVFPYYSIRVGNRPAISMRQGAWRLYKFFFDGPARQHRFELYNLDNDIEEQENLISKYPDVVDHMRKKIREHEIEADYLLPRLNTLYAGNVEGLWRGSDGIIPKMANNTLVFQSADSQSFVETNYFPAVENDTYILEFEMKSDSNGDGHILWQCNGEAQWLPSKREVLATLHDSTWHKYSIPMKTGGQVKTLRIYPSGGPGTIAMKNFRLKSRDGYELFEWSGY